MKELGLVTMFVTSIWFEISERLRPDLLCGGTPLLISLIVKFGYRLPVLDIYAR